MFDDNSPMTTQPTESYQYTQAPQTGYDYASYQLQPVNQQKNSHDNKSAVIVLAALAILVAAIVAFLIIDPLNLLGKSDQAAEDTTMQQPVDQTEGTQLEPASETTALNITINSVDKEQFPSVDVYATITSTVDDLASKLNATTLKATEIVNGNEIGCTITGVTPTSSSGSYKISYTATLATSDGSKRDIKISAAEGSGFDGYSTYSYTPPTTQAATQDQAQQQTQTQTEPAQDSVEKININVNVDGANGQGTTTTYTTTTKTAYYILPNSDSRVYSYDELRALNDSDLTLARNEIFARHGYIFKLEQFSNYFNSQSWYVPRYNSQDSITLNSYEKTNIARIQEIEAERGLG